MLNIAGAVGGVTDTDTTRAVAALLQAAAGESDAFVINADGRSLRDYTHVLDVALAFRLAVKTSAAATTPTTSGQELGSASPSSSPPHAA